MPNRINGYLLPKNQNSKLAQGIFHQLRWHFFFLVILHRDILQDMSALFPNGTSTTAANVHPTSRSAQKGKNPDITQGHLLHGSEPRPGAHSHPG